MAQLRAAGTRRPGGAGPHILGGPVGLGETPEPRAPAAGGEGAGVGVRSAQPTLTACAHHPHIEG